MGLLRLQTSEGAGAVTKTAAGVEQRRVTVLAPGVSPVRRRRRTRRSRVDTCIATIASGRDVSWTRSLGVLRATNASWQSGSLFSLALLLV